MSEFLIYFLLFATGTIDQQIAMAGKAAVQRAEFHKQTAAMLPYADAKLSEEIADALQDSGREFDVDPKLMLALVYVESAGNPRAVSKVGALGLTQVMPETGEQIARELGVPWTGPKMLFDVRVNIRFGTFYMRQLLDRFDNKKHAIASYNFGPNGISRRLRNGQNIPSRYASKVLRNRARVERL